MLFYLFAGSVQAGQFCWNRRQRSPHGGWFNTQTVSHLSQVSNKDEIIISTTMVIVKNDDGVRLMDGYDLIFSTPSSNLQGWVAQSVRAQCK
jgi:hypothetical protein